MQAWRRCVGLERVLQGRFQAIDKLTDEFAQLLEQIRSARRMAGKRSRARASESGRQSIQVLQVG